jgi:polyhydroxyalkanoate synthesis regulator phasin
MVCIIADKYEEIVYNLPRYHSRGAVTMQKMTLKAYAVKHKISLFNVVKMVKSGKLRSEVVEENGKEVTYILPDPAQNTTEKRQEQTSQPTLSQEELHTLVLSLQEEVTRLRQEMDHLKISIGLKG